MALSVWKYQLQVRDYQEVEMPQDAAILSAGVQNSVPVVWALVNTDPDYPKTKRKIRMMGTGHPMSDEEGYQAEFIGTIFPIPGLVFHLFELVK